MHQRLEARLAVERGHWTLDRYIAFLQGSLQIVGFAEPIIERHLKPCSYQGSRATDRLQHDLEAVGAVSLPRDASRLPQLDSLASAFGAAYVLNGARLGGQIIARLLSSRLGLAPTQLTYLAPAERSAASDWQSFTTILDGYGTGSSEPTWRLVADVAVDTFESFEQALDDAGALDGS